MASIEQLLQPLDGESPTGPDLSYDDKRLEIEAAFEAAGAIQAGESDPTDWPKVVDLILAQAEQTRDAWLAVYLARAGARGRRLDTVELGVEYLAGLFENFWDTAHPRLEQYEFQGRKAPCESLVRISEFIGPLRRMPFVAHPRLGTFSGEDVERFAREGEAAENYGPFRAALDDLPQEEIQETLTRLERIRNALSRVDEALSAHADSDTGTNFTPTYAAIDAIRSGLANFGMIEIEAPPEQAGGDAEAAPAAAGEVGRLRSSIESRDDVIKALDAIVDYYRRREPSSPVPVAIARARNWVNMDFLAVLADIAPDSIGEARRALTSPPADA